MWHARRGTAQGMADFAAAPEFGRNSKSASTQQCSGTRFCSAKALQEASTVVGEEPHVMEKQRPRRSKWKGLAGRRFIDFT